MSHCWCLVSVAVCCCATEKGSRKIFWSVNGEPICIWIGCWLCSRFMVSSTFFPVWFGLLSWKYNCRLFSGYGRDVQERNGANREWQQNEWLFLICHGWSLEFQLEPSPSPSRALLKIQLNVVGSRGSDEPPLNSGSLTPSKRITF